jgi:hypothetical protein
MALSGRVPLVRALARRRAPPAATVVLPHRSISLHARLLRATSTAVAPPPPSGVSGAHSAAAVEAPGIGGASVAADAVGVVRTNVGIFGAMNTGKSTLMNALTQQATSIVGARESKLLCSFLRCAACS